MAFDQDMELVERVRQALAAYSDKLQEKKMFGGLCFLLNGKMCIAVRDHELMIHLRSEDYEGALSQAGTRPMIHRDRPVTGVVFVAGSAVASDTVLQKWVDLALTANAARIAKEKR